MSNTGDGRDGENREAADASVDAASERVAPAEPVTDASSATPTEPVTDTSQGSPTDDSGARMGDTAVYDSGLIEPADGRTAGAAAADTQVGVPADAPDATTTAPAAPGPLGPGDTAIVDPVVAPSRQAPDSVESPVRTGASASAERDAAGRTEATHGAPAEAPTGTAQPVPERTDPSGSGYVPGAPYSADADADTDADSADAGSVHTDSTAAAQAGVASGGAAPGSAAPGSAALGGAAPAEADPGAPVDDEPEDSKSRLDAAVQRANAVPEASGAAADETPDPVAADSVRRETYVPPAAGGAAVGAATLAGGPHGPQTVYVQAPTPPKAKSNRGFGVLVALIGTAVFAVLYAAVSYVLFLGQAGGDATELFLQFLTRPIFWVPVIATFVGFALLVVIVNRGAWWMYAVFGLLVGVLVYFSYIGAALLTVNAWELTQQQAIDFVNSRWLDPLAIAAGVIAREVPIWLGGWIAKRGRGVAERNRLAMEAYDRELAAGPRPIAR